MSEWHGIVKRTGNIEEIGARLDAMTHKERVKAVRSMCAGTQAMLWQMADGREVTLEDMVPADLPPLTEVIHFGKNSLPVLSSFEKRFCRLPGEDPEAPGALAGYNFQSLAPLTGPGYFMAFDDPDRGEVRVDYRRLPERKPADWPAIRSNESGLARFVYGFMVDTLRRVSEHVTIGSAARKGRDLGSYFALARCD